MEKGNSGPDIETFEFQGHTVMIRKDDIGAPVALWIDGRRHRILHSKDGYNLGADAFQPPKETLVEAVKDYLKRMEPAREEKTNNQ